MRVLLISPFRGLTYESVGIRVPPLGLLYIAAVLRQAGHDVELDVSEDPQQQENLDFSYYDVVGLTSTTCQFNKALKIAERATHAGKIVIMGGPHPTSSADEALKSGFVNYVVRGEGEDTATELFEALPHRSTANFGKILGLSWIDESTGQIIHNPPRPFITNLDRLPYPVRDLGGSAFHYRNLGVDGQINPSLVTTRGCPFGCKFCDVHILAGQKFRTRSPHLVVDEIEYLATEFGARNIRILDDIINFSPERVHQLFNEIIRRRLQLNIWVMGRADMLLRDPSTVEVMARAGVKTMFLGIESPHKRILKAFHKGGKASADTSSQAVNLLREYGIGTFAGFILGEFSETEQEIKQTIDYACELNPATAQFSILTPYPGTETWQTLKPHLITRDWDLYDGLHAVFDGQHLTALEMEHLLRKAYLKFYLRPGRLMKQLAAAATQKGYLLGAPRVKTVLQIFKLLRGIYPRSRKMALERR